MGSALKGYRYWDRAELDVVNAPPVPQNQAKPHPEGIISTTHMATYEPPLSAVADGVGLRYNQSNDMWEGVMCVYVRDYEDRNGWPVRLPVVSSVLHSSQDSACHRGQGGVLEIKTYKRAWRSPGGCHADFLHGEPFTESCGG